MVIYWRFVYEFTVLRSALLMLPYVATHAFWSTVSARIVSRLAHRGPNAKSYLYMLPFGFTLWPAAMLVLAFVPRKPTVWTVIALEIMVGFGTGSVFPELRQRHPNSGHSPRSSCRHQYPQRSAVYGRRDWHCALHYHYAVDAPT